MTEEMGTWAVIGSAALGIAAAIIAFLRTPPERRYRVLSAYISLEEQLKDCPESAQAILIKGNKKRALVKSAPYIFIGTILVGFSLWSKNTGNTECVRLLDINAAYISLLLVCYALPVGFLVVSLLFFGTGVRTIRTGYFPPLDSTVFRDTIAKKGPVSTARGVVLLVLPIFAGFVVYLGNNAYTQIAGGKSMHEIVEKIEAKCQ
jgi:hypothetical protein